MSKNGECLTTFAETPPTSSHLIQLSAFLPTSEKAASFLSPQWITNFSYTVDDIMHVYL